VLNASQLKRLNHLKSLTSPKILLQRADRLGDAIFISPVIEQIHDVFPKARIDLLTSSVGCDLFYHHPHVKNIRILSNKVLTNWKYWFKELFFLKQQDYDAYICLWNHPRLAWLGFAANIPIRCGDSSSLLLNMCYNHAVSLPWENMTYHQINYNCLLLSGLGITSKSLNRSLYPDPIAYQNQYNQWQQTLSSSKKSIVIICGTGGSSDPIPSQVIIEWITTSAQIATYQVILVGQLDHNDPLISFKTDGIWNKINKTSLSELITIIDLADVIVGGDTGPSHLASFLNKALIFYSPLKKQAPSSWGPFSDYSVIIRYDYLSPNDEPIPLITLLDTAFCNLTQNPNLNFAKTEQEKYARLLKHSIRILIFESLRSKLNKDTLSCIQQLQNQGLILYQFKLPIVWILTVFSIINIIRNRNITVIMAHTLPLGLLPLIRFIMGTIFQYRKPLFISFSDLPPDNLVDIWSILKTKKW
tara:strand:- start:4716 stop:6134 length:1419 start_codon:yes stop_codon:yes gene_type:complete